MTVKDLIEKLQNFPDDLPVKIKTYSCGYDSWTEISPAMIIATMDYHRDIPIIEITADWN